MKEICNLSVCLLQYIALLILVNSSYTPEKIVRSSASSLIIYWSRHMITKVKLIATIWKTLQPLKISNNSQQPTFYAIHAVSLSRFSLTATKHLLGQLHFQAKLCKNTGFWQFTRDQNTTMFKMAALRLNTSVTSSAPANHLSRERKQIFTVFTWPRSRIIMIMK